MCCSWNLSSDGLLFHSDFLWNIDHTAISNNNICCWTIIGTGFGTFDFLDKGHA